MRSAGVKPAAIFRNGSCRAALLALVLVVAQIAFAAHAEIGKTHNTQTCAFCLSAPSAKDPNDSGPEFTAPQFVLAPDLHVERANIFETDGPLAAHPRGPPILTPV